MKSTRLLALAAAATLLPGCYFAGRTIPLDPSGMAFPLHYAGASIEDQAQRTGATVAGLTDALSRHCRECWRNLSTDPADR